MAKTQTLVDNFSNPATLSTLWGRSYGSTVIAGDEAAIPTSGPGAALLSTSSTLNFTGSYILAQVAPFQAADSQVQLAVQLSASNVAYVSYYEGTMYGTIVQGGTQTNSSGIAYSATTHAWWRVREQSGTIYYEVGPDGLKWSQIWSTTYTINLTSVEVYVYCVTNSGSSGTTYLKNFNIIPAVTQPAVSPPGFLSPAAFPFPNGPFGLPNDAPPTTPQPYLISNASIGGVSSNTLAIPVQYPTSRGDAIAVLLEYGSGLGNTVSCIDTQGNSYSLAVAQHNQNPWNAIYVAQNSNPLTVADTITVTFSGSTSQSRITIVVGCPTGAVTSSPGSSWLTCTSSASNTAGASSVAVATSAAVSGPMIIIGLAASPAASPIPRFPQNWNTLAVNSTDGQLVAAFLSATSVPAGSTVFQALSASSTSMSAQYVTLQLETRFASQPGLMPGSQASPPGLMSPGAWPVFPLEIGEVNDAYNGVPVPYLISQSNTVHSSSATITVYVNILTGRGDAITVLTQTSTGGAVLSVTDTQGNIYSQTISELALAPYTSIWVAQNTLALSSVNNDSITVTFTTANTNSVAVVTGCSAAAVVPQTANDWLTFSQVNVNEAGNGPLSVTTPNPIPGPVMLISSVSTGSSGSPTIPLFPQDWVVMITSTANNYFIVAYKLVSHYTPSGATVVSVLHGSGGNIIVSYVALPLETSIAPNRPSPDMPPGMQSPGAWQYQPMQRSFNTLNNVTLPGNTGLVNIAAPQGTASELMYNPVSSVSQLAVQGVLYETIVGSDSSLSTVAPLGTSQLNVQSVAAHNTIAAIDGSLTELITGNVSVVVQMADQGVVVLSASGSIADVTVDAENGTLHLPLVFTAPPASVDISALAGGFPVYLRGIPVTVTESALSGYLEILAIPGVAYWSGQLIIPDYDQRLI